MAGAERVVPPATNRRKTYLPAGWVARDFSKAGVLPREIGGADATGPSADVISRGERRVWFGFGVFISVKRPDVNPTRRARDRSVPPRQSPPASPPGANPNRRARARCRKGCQ